jgi:hypothetical protein
MNIHNFTLRMEVTSLKISWPCKCTKKEPFASKSTIFSYTLFCTSYTLLDGSHPWIASRVFSWYFKCKQSHGWSWAWHGPSPLTCKTSQCKKINNWMVSIMYNFLTCSNLLWQSVYKLTCNVKNYQIHYNVPCLFI